MSDQFLHGVELIEIDSGTRPVKTLKSSVIGLVGTAPYADETVFPYNTPVAITTQKAAAELVSAAYQKDEKTQLVTNKLKENVKDDVLTNGFGTLPDAVKGIFDQSGATIVIVRVEEGADKAATITNLVGSGATGTGVYSLLAASSICKVEPRIIIAPGCWEKTAENKPSTYPVATALEVVANRLKAIGIVDCPDTNKEGAVTYKEKFGSKRLYFVYPEVKVWDSVANSVKNRPLSPRAAGLIVKSDNERGFWWSPSNLTINGILGISKPIDFKLGDTECTANFLK